MVVHQKKLEVVSKLCPGLMPHRLNVAVKAYLLYLLSVKIKIYLAV